MPRKAKTFEEKLQGYVEKTRKERERLGIHEQTAIHFPNGRPGITGKLALWLLRGSGAEIMTEYRDISNK